MSRLSPHHHELTDGVGKCSVPMWSGCGGEAGFCDAPAYGPPTPCEMRRGPYWDPAPRRVDGKFSGYVPGLACPNHGGPTQPDRPTVPR